MLAKRIDLLLGKSLAVLSAEAGLKLLERRLQHFLTELRGYRWIVRVSGFRRLVPLLRQVILQLSESCGPRADLAVIFIVNSDLSGIAQSRGSDLSLLPSASAF